MIELSPTEIDALDGDCQRIGVFFRMATTPLIRLWLGVGDCRVGDNAYDDGGATYSGLGQLLGVPAVTQLINGTAERVSFQVSGVSQELLAKASADSDLVRGVMVNLGIGIFGPDWQQLGVPKWLFRGSADFMTVSQASGDDGAITRTIELSVGSRMTGRRRAGLSYLTDQDQQARSSGDRFCERTVLYTNTINKVWPRFL